MNKKNLHYIALLLSILLIAGISLANMQTVTVNFLLVQFKLPLIILILLCVLLGAFVMTLVNFSKGFSLKKELKSTQKQLEEEKKEIKTEEKENNQKSTDCAFFMLMYLLLLVISWRLFVLGVKRE